MLATVPLNGEVVNTTWLAAAVVMVSVWLTAGKDEVTVILAVPGVVEPKRKLADEFPTVIVAVVIGVPLRVENFPFGNPLSERPSDIADVGDRIGDGFP